MDLLQGGSNEHGGAQTRGSDRAQAALDLAPDIRAVINFVDPLLRALTKAGGEVDLASLAKDLAIAPGSGRRRGRRDREPRRKAAGTEIVSPEGRQQDELQPCTNGG